MAGGHQGRHTEVSTCYGQTAAAFDRAAPSYDALYQSNGMMTWLRQQNLAAFQAAFPTSSRLLEIGCGTGEEALALGRLGYRIVATDLCPAMIACARSKPLKGATPVEWRVLPAGELAALLPDYGPAAFDGAYSSFGALNCEPQLDQVASALANLLRPGASLICSVMNRWCGWEIGWGLMHLKPRYAFRRLRRRWTQAGLAVPDGTQAVPVRYHTARAFACAFAPYFEPRRVSGWPVFLPPPSLDPFDGRFPTLRARLEGAEKRWRGRWPLSALGDHFLIVLERAGSTVE